MSNNLRNKKQVDRSKFLLLASFVLILSSCSWFTDFKQQPSVGPWQEFSSDSAAGKGFRGNPAGSVPVTGDRKSTRLNSSHSQQSRMPSSA